MKKLLLNIILLLLVQAVFAQDKFTVSGYIKDSKNGEALIGASILVKELSTGTATNVYGFYSLTLPKGNYTFVFSYLGYQNNSRTVDLTKNQKIDLELTESNVGLQEVVITGEREDVNVKSMEMSVNKMDIKTIEKIPALLGEVDIVRSIQMLPGVTTVGEGASGFNVRGGGVDQNLVLLDEAPVYNSSHLFGFFSVFNPDAVSDVKLVKGGIESKYGGRLSSLLDVRMKEGNSKKLAVSGGVGAIFSRLTIEAPIIKDTCSFIIAARRSYADILAKPFLSDNLKDAKFNFYDLTAKGNYLLNDKNRLFLSAYFGRDVFGAPGFGFNWGNATSTLRWNHLFNDKVFMNLTAIYSDYDYEIGANEKDVDSFNWNSSIINYSLKSDFTYYPNLKNTITFGAQSIYFDFVPGTFVFKSGGETNNMSLDDKYALESSVYIGNEQEMGARLALQYGIRYSFYQYLGKGKAYEFDNAPAGTRKDLISEREYQQGEVIKQYNFPEPRFSVKYELTTNSSLKASYNRMAQYVHLISNTTAATPLDVWTPSTNNIKPQLADQVALGYFKNFGVGNDYETSLEIYYKDMYNQIDYINNANVFLNEQIEAELLSGKGRAFGAELYIKRNKGKLNGWISYTLSKTERKVEGISKNEWFPARYDKPHNFVLFVNYDLTERWSFSSDFVYASGTPATFPTNRVEFQGYIIPHNVTEMRNNYRIPDYHRMDVSATLKGKKREKYESYWVFSVYNVYNRRNPFSVFFRQDSNNRLITEAVRYSIIGSVVPAVSYNFKF